MPKAIAELGNRFLNDPVRVSVAPQSTTAERVEQYVTFIDQREKQALLNHKLQDDSIDRALVFTRTKHGADRVVRHLAGAGIKAAAIHGNKSQGQRTAALQAFRAGQIKILVATDIAARGIDVPGVSHVFNFELPNVPEQYVHRIGRTARAGADGIAVSFVADDERAYLKDIERLTKVRAMQEGLPEGFRQLVANMPKPVAPPRSEQPRGRGGRPGGRPEGSQRSGPRRSEPRNFEGRTRDDRGPRGNPVREPREGGFNPAASRDEQRDNRRHDGDRRPQREGGSENRGGHKRGGPPVAGASNGRDGQKPRNYGPKKGGVGKYTGAVKRVG